MRRAITAMPRLIDPMPMDEADALATLDAMAAIECMPVGCFGRAAKLAKPLQFLLSDISSYITGLTLVIDGSIVHLPHSSAEKKD